MPSGTDIRASSAARDPSRTEPEAVPESTSAPSDPGTSAPTARDAGVQDTLPVTPEPAPAAGRPQKRADSGADENPAHSAGLGPEALVLVAVAATDPPWLTLRP